MTFFCIMLIAFSALMHAGWNLICKSRHPSAAFFLVSTAASITAMLPLTICHIPIITRLPAGLWGLLVFSSMAQAVYYTSLGNAYRLSEMSVAYPLAKAMPVLFIPAVTMLLCLGKPLDGGALFGMLLVSSGCIILPMPSFQSISPRNYWGKGFFYIFIAALTTTAYTIIDSEALKIFRHADLAGAAATALVYIALENIMIELFLLPYILLHRRERQTFLQIVSGRQLLYPAISGVACTASYSLVLVAMMMATNVSYIAAFRQLSIPLGAILGIIIFKESSSLPKTAGIALIFIGLLIVGMNK